MVFFILNQQEYHSKMLVKLNNSLHYDKVDSDPTLNYFEQVKNWGRKWLSERQISQEIATWITKLEPKPGVAFGNVKTHKTDNPLRLITFCCGTAIEGFSAFTEFELKSLSQKLPSFIKDSTDLINNCCTCQDHKLEVEALRKRLDKVHKRLNIACFSTLFGWMLLPTFCKCLLLSDVVIGILKEGMDLVIMY